VIPIAGRREIYGFRQDVMGPLDKGTRKKSSRR